MALPLKRTTFSTKRLMEFFSEKELNMQLGHSRAMWPIALLKELLDNAIDAAELAGVTPEIVVSLAADAFSVQDNGAGLPIETLERSLDYLVRVSDKAHYVSPTRGQLGNALKCVWAAPFVADGGRGRVDVTTGATRHQIEVTLDRIAQEPCIEHTRHADRTVKIGTKITVHWPGIASYDAPRGEDVFLQTEDDDEIASYQDEDGSPIFLQMADLVRRFALFNPHVRVTVKQPKVKPIHWSPTDTTWQHWAADRPTSPHWYTLGHLRALIAAYLTDQRNGGRPRTVREFVSEFAGLAGSAKQQTVTHAAALSKGALLQDLVVDGDVAIGPVTHLLAAMQAASRPVKPAALGTVGQTHLTARLEAAEVDPESVRYAKRSGFDDDGVSFVVEIAFGIHAERSDERTHAREVTVGLNWSPALGVPVEELRSLLGAARVDPWDPVTMIVHIACPRFEWLDRGKSEVAV